MSSWGGVPSCKFAWMGLLHFLVSGKFIHLQYLFSLLSVISMLLKSLTLFWDYQIALPHFAGFVQLGHEGTLAGKVSIRVYVAKSYGDISEPSKGLR